MNFLIISAHDYRSRRKAGIHYVAAELEKLGTTRFFSCRYSLLSRLKHDTRNFIDKLANKKTIHDGVECYLWKTIIHPFNFRIPMLRFIENVLYRIYVGKPSEVMEEWIKEADTIFFDSGISPIFFDLVKKLNPTARTIYIASDNLDTIHVADYVQRTFDRVAPQMTMLCLKSRFMAAVMPPSNNKYVIPHGFDFSIADHADPTPYDEGQHAVSLGSMLFDPAFIVSASNSFPKITFHVIGSGLKAQPGYGKNVRLYEEMSHVETLPYIKHATFGVAPYDSSQVPDYLADTSLKLMQYDFFKLPAVCPIKVAADYCTRFGYEPGNTESVIRAINAAIKAPRVSCGKPLAWSESVARMLDPEQFEDTSLIQEKASKF
jgi:2-beta-glucuronyltransferase